ncbi:MAG: hypothetical protein U0165_11080 [Polyangiaceae bacterium]
MSRNPRAPEEPELPDDYQVPYGFRTWSEKLDPDSKTWSVELLRAEDLGRAVGGLFAFFTSLVVSFFTFWAEPQMFILYIGGVICVLSVLATLKWLSNRVRFQVDREAFSYAEKTLFTKIAKRFETSKILRFSTESDPARWADGRWFVILEDAEGRHRVTSFEGVNERGKSAAHLLAERLEEARRRFVARA